MTTPTPSPPPAPYDQHEREVLQLVVQRDRLETICDDLAAAIAPPEVLGEHTSGNDPWRNALDYADTATQRRDAATTRPEILCSKADHWHQGTTVTANVCVRGIIHGLQQDSAGFRRALDAVEAGGELPGAELTGHLRVIGGWIDAVRPDVPRDLLEQVRVNKVASEAGEVQDALDIAQGWNPRKAGTKTHDDVQKELLDTAVAALGALEFLRGYDGTSLGALVQHAGAVADRIGHTS